MNETKTRQIIYRGGPDDGLERTVSMGVVQVRYNIGKYEMLLLQDDQGRVLFDWVPNEVQD